MQGSGLESRGVSQVEKGKIMIDVPICDDRMRFDDVCLHVKTW